MSESTVKPGLMSPDRVGGNVRRGNHPCRQIACNEANESGGVLGRQLELVIEDDGQPARQRSRCRQVRSINSVEPDYVAKLGLTARISCDLAVYVSSSAGLFID